MTEKDSDSDESIIPQAIFTIVMVGIYIFLFTVFCVVLGDCVNACDVWHHRPLG